MHTSKEAQPTPAKHHSAFSWQRSEHIESLNLTIEEYRHNKTGALHYHLAGDNPENVFLVALRTMPEDSTGVAHILEHTALCGSKRYPVRDPFFMMIRRSLNTFMNAFTSSDWTAYPFASQNRKDFFNLLDVYLDAVFFSRLHPLDFAQEGHRMEFENPQDANSHLVYKGVVFNEMKGSMASPVNTLWQTLTKHLFPTTTYHYNSGGDPESIPDLTYEQFMSFYKTHYHPSNAIFMTYGDIPAHEHQAIMEDRALQHFDKLDVKIWTADEKRYHAPVSVQEYYALDDDTQTENKTHIVIGWLLDNSTDLEASLKAQLLSGVLLDNSASPLMQALETTDLGNAPSPLCGVEDSNREMTFMCGLEGSTPVNAEKVEELVLSVLKEVAEQGVPQQQVEAVLHQLELDQREVGGGSYPYGLQLILEALPCAVHRGDPVAVLNLDPVLIKLREAIQDENFIKRLVQETLLDNPHRVRLTLAPDANISTRRQRAEAAKLAKIKAGMQDNDKQNVIDLAQKLAERQAHKDDESILPKVTLSDVPEQMYIAECETTNINKIPATIYKQGTNGLVYQQAVFELPKLDEELLAYLSYYTSNLTELGCGNRTYLETQVELSSVTGGINTFTAMRGKTDDVQDISGYFFVSGKALQRNHKALTQLMLDFIKAPRFDELTRIQELISQQRAHREQSVTGHGHSLAMTAASSGMGPTAALRHRLNGLEGIRHIKKLDDELEDEAAINKLAERFEALHNAVTQAKQQLLVIGEEHYVDEYLANVTSLWQSSQSNVNNNAFALPPVNNKVKQCWITSTPVSFCAKAYPGVTVDHEDAAALTVLAGFLRNGFLHTAIREKGGAYGGGASFSSEIASFRFYSYRDPRLSDTLTDFDRSVEWLLTEKHEWRQVEEAILGVISSIDKPSSPAGEAKDAFQNTLFGRTAEKRQAFRAKILKVTLEDLQRVGEKYLQPANASIAVIAGAAMTDEAGKLGLDVNKL